MGETGHQEAEVHPTSADPVGGPHLPCACALAVERQCCRPFAPLPRQGRSGERSGWDRGSGIGRLLLKYSLAALSELAPVFSPLLPLFSES